MSDLEEQVAKLEATEKEVQEKQSMLEQTKAQVTDYEQKKSALDQELARVQADIVKQKEERRQIDVKDTTFQEKLRGENLEAAKVKFFNQFTYKPEDQSKFIEAFKSFDTQAVNADLIYNDLLKTRVALDPSKYIKLEEETVYLRHQAEEFNKGGSSSGFPDSGMPSGSSNELNEDEIRAANWAHIAPEKYKELKAKGLID